jgi:hypothetical protein
MLALIALTFAGCGSGSTIGGGATPSHAEALAVQRADRLGALAQAHAVHLDMLHALHSCSEHALIRAANAVPLEKCTDAIEALEHEYKAQHLTETEAHADLDRIDWMHPSDPRGHEGTQAFAVAQTDFKLAFSYTEAPHFPTEPSCIDWAKAGEYGDVAYLARAGWPYAYLPQGLQTVSYTCERVAAEGTADNVLLGFLVCTSVLQNAIGTGTLTESQRLAVEHGIECGENLPETKARKEREAQRQAKEEREQKTQEEREAQRQAKEEREQATIEKPAEEQDERAYEEGQRAGG